MVKNSWSEDYIAANQRITLVCNK